MQTSCGRVGFLPGLFLGGLCHRAPPKSKNRSSPSSQTIHKPRRVISPRVQAVGPEHFGIACVDCAKARSKWMLTDFYGRVLVPPTEVEHTQACFTSMIRDLRTA